MQFLLNRASVLTCVASLAMFATALAVSAHESDDHAKQTTMGSKHPGGSNTNLANQATNPAAALVQLQLQNVFVPKSDNSSGYANTFIVQPVIPFHLGDDSYFQSLIVRPTIPLAVTTPNPDGREARTTAIGDTTVLLVPTHVNPPHKKNSGHAFGTTWGPIAAVVIPTSTDKRTGGDNLAAGPGLLGIAATKNVFTDGDSLQFGAYGYNIWDVASDNNDVSTLFAGPVVVYHFKELFDQPGWYLAWTDQLMSWDWETNSADGGKATIPLGARLGRVFNIGSQPMNIFVESDYYAKHRGTSPEWDIKLNVTFLFPK